MKALTAAAGGLAAVALLALTGCGSAAVGAAPAAGSGGTSQVAGGRCTIYDSGQDAQVVVTLGDQGECSKLATDLSSSGHFWTMQPQSTSDTLSMVCVMDSGGCEAEVIDGGGQIIGHELCSNFLSSGWTEDTAAEQQITQQAQQQQAAQPSASTSAQASQAQAQQVAQDQQTASQDITSLRGNAGAPLAPPTPGRRPEYYAGWLTCCLIVFIGAWVGINQAPPRSGLSYAMGWTIAIGLAGAWCR